MQIGQPFNPRHSPATVNHSERIARAQREIEAIEAEIRAGNPDLQGLCRGLVDWSCELRRLEKERAEPSELAGTAAQGSADAASL
jgi:hypothetical protein